MPNTSLASFAARKARAACRKLKWKVLTAKYRLPEIPIGMVCPPHSADKDEVILDDVCMAPFKDDLTHDDLGTILRIARSVGPRLICEIGTAHGNLTANLLKSCPQASMITVNAPADLQTGTIVTYELAAAEIGRVYRKYGFETRVRQVLLNSLQLDLAEFGIADNVDLGIVDACHDREYVMNDFEKLRTFIRPGGVILLHDTHPSQKGHLAGSYHACLMLRKAGFDVKWILGTWWGYWRKPDVQKSN